jgi:hypothetical protein
MTRIALLLRHKWVAEPALETWICLPLAVCLDPSISDPVCPGCRSTIDFSELEEPQRYPDAASLQLALDLLFARLTVKAARELYEATRIKT